MARGDQQASTAESSANKLSNQNAGQANALYGALAPELEAEAAHPSGYTPQQQADMNTAAQQSAGGSMAGAVGQGGLLASRTKNAGGADAAIQQSARQAGQQAGQAALGVKMKNADLMQKQKQAGLSGLGNLFGQTNGQAVNALGQVAANSNANTNAENASWNWTKGLDAFTGPASQSKFF